MSKHVCKGGCGNPASHKGWCKIKWQSGKRFAVGCPAIEAKRAKSIASFRIKEAKLGKNPMQSPNICKKNHSTERNRKASETLKKLGEKGLLPQQKESKELKERRRLRNQKALQKMWKEGKHPLQSKSKEELNDIRRKISRTLMEMAERGELPVQNFSQEKKQSIAKKVSKKLREGIGTGRIKLSPGWKKVFYKDKILRSNWEKETAQFLDDYNIHWEYESLILPYYDTSRDLVAHTIPDFYLPDYNAVIEVKSNGLFNSKQTKDKMEGIANLGYRTFLFGKKQIKLIQNKNNIIIRAIKNEKS